MARVWEGSIEHKEEEYIGGWMDDEKDEPKKDTHKKLDVYMFIVRLIAVTAVGSIIYMLAGIGIESDEVHEDVKTVEQRQKYRKAEIQKIQNNYMTLSNENNKLIAKYKSMDCMSHVSTCSTVQSCECCSMAFELDQHATKMEHMINTIRAIRNFEK